MRKLLLDFGKIESRKRCNEGQFQFGKMFLTSLFCKIHLGRKRDLQFICGHTHTHTHTHMLANCKMFVQSCSESSQFDSIG
mmetsp:Transcript_1636/g.2569  ORF Transcript_1636/g.2569 Transcript_1636/m.2569 type:complete len:81 (+) Transcript_1636:493-735(+)